MARGRGGYRKPGSPAAASGPGALSQRTDGGPSASLVPSGGDYGDRKARQDMQQAAPMGGGGGGGAPAPGGGGGGGAPRDPAGIFGESTRPNEAMTAGIPMGDGDNGPGVMLEDDPDMLLRAIFQRNPHPDIARLLARRGG